MKKVILLCIGMLLLTSFSTSAQKYKRKKQQNTTQFAEKYYDAIQWRNIGPFRGGRSGAVTGVPGKANLFYMGSTGGGIWKTTDAGNTWENISDGFFLRLHRLHSCK